jgi:hypothetical protein
MKHNIDYSIQQNNSSKTFGIIYMPNMSYLVHILCEKFRNYILVNLTLQKQRSSTDLIVHLFHSIHDKHIANQHWNLSNYI